MSGGIYSLMNVAQNSLSTANQGLSVAGSNITNIDTPGYTKKRMVIEPILSNTSRVGMGPQVVDVERVVDKFLEKQMNEAESDLSRYDTLRYLTKEIEGVFSDGEEYGLAYDMDRFFNSFGELANTPNDSNIRSTVVAAAQDLVTTFQLMDAQLAEINNNSSDVISESLTDVNGILNSLAAINDQISAIDANGGSANELLDKRTNLLNDLAKYMDIITVDGAGGILNVYSSRGLALVSRGTPATLTKGLDTSGNTTVLTTVGSSTTDMSSHITSGSLKSHLDMINTEVPYYEGLLDSLAYTFVTQVNTVHGGGYNLDGETSVDFFTALTSQTNAAANLSVSTTITGNTDKIAAASTLASLPGGNGNALALYQLKDSLVMNGTQDTFGDAYGKIVSEVGLDVKSVNTRREVLSVNKTQLLERRESISGISIDEEMADLLKFEQAFKAAAQIIQIADDMLDLLVNTI